MANLVAEDAVYYIDEDGIWQLSDELFTIKTEYIGDVDRAYLIKFFGLRGRDVEWFRIEELRKDLFREPGNNEGCKWHLLCRLQPPRVYDGVELILRISRNTPICREIIVIIQISAVNIAEITIVGLDRGAQVQLWRVGFCTCPIKPIEKI